MFENGSSIIGWMVVSILVSGEIPNEVNRFDTGSK